MIAALRTGRGMLGIAISGAVATVGAGTFADVLIAANGPAIIGIAFTQVVGYVTGIAFGRAGSSTTDPVDAVTR